MASVSTFWQGGGNPTSHFLLFRLYVENLFSWMTSDEHPSHFDDDDLNQKIAKQRNVEIFPVLNMENDYHIRILHA